jgi:hypothetical protein
MRAAIGAILVLATASTLAGCGTVTVPPAGARSARPGASTPAPAVPGPPAGSRAEATALAGRLLSRLRLPSGARRLPATPLPPAVRQAYAAPGGADHLDLYRLFAAAQPMNALAGVLAARVPAGLSLDGTGSGWDRDVETMREVDYAPRSVPAGIYSAQLVLTVVPATSGGSLLLADAQVIWYPSRTAAEYIDPARYHVLNVAVTLFGHSVHTIHRVVTSQAVINRLAGALNRSQAEPPVAFGCPAIFAEYRLGLSVSRHTRPVVVITTNQWSCGGSGITVDGRAQPGLADGGAVAALVNRALGIKPTP